MTRLPEGFNRAPSPALLGSPVNGALPAVAVRGGARYEPNWDGLRLLIAVDAPNTDPRVRLWCQHGTDLTARFPDLTAAAIRQLPHGTCLDGVLILPGTTYVAFDVLATAGIDVRERELRLRRVLLEGLAVDWVDPMTVTPQTTDGAVASGWLAKLPSDRTNGVVVKAGAGTYRGGSRDWVTVRSGADRPSGAFPPIST